MLKRIIKGKPKPRHYVAIAIIIASIAATPWAIRAAEMTRGYQAVGGEYLLPVIGFLIGWLIALVGKDLETLLGRKEEDGK